LVFSRYQEINRIISSDLSHWRGIPTRQLVIVAGSCYVLRQSVRTIWKKNTFDKCIFEVKPEY